MSASAPPPTTREARPSRRSRLALLALASAFALLTSEGVLRLFFPEVGKLRRLVVSTDDERGFAPRPGVSIAFDGVFAPLSHTVTWQTNAQGMREDREIGPPGERFRIATYGDSETFGWSVALAETFQRRMEALDPRVEVLNFGVPGYNVTNIRDQIERSVPRFRPDLALYLVNKNDFNDPVRFTPLSHSHVLLHLRFLWHFGVGKALREDRRGSLERRAVFGREVERMTRFLEARDIPFVLGFLKWKDRASVRDHPPEGRERSGVPASNGGTPRRFGRELVDVKAVLAGERKEDGHWAAPAHRKMARLFCRVVSGAAEGACVPPGWKRASRGPERSAGAVSARF